MQKQEQFKNMLRFLFNFLILSIQVSVWAFFWMTEYANSILRPFGYKGNWLFFVVYGIISFFFTSLYGGYRIGSLRRADIVLSGWISIIFTNSVIYLQTCLVGRAIMAAHPFLWMTAADFLLFLLWSAFANNIYARIFPPHKMLIIHGGGGQSLQLIDKMAARSEKYLIQEAIGTDVGKTILSGKIAEYAAVVLCDLSAEDRNYYIKLCFEKDVRVYTTPKISDILLRSAENITLFDTPLLLNRNYGLSLEQKFLKRTIDIVLAVIMLTVAMPFMLFTAIAVKLQDGGPVLYRQERLTLHGKSFTLYKFRSMVVDAEKQHGMQLSTQNDSRITKVGEFIRRTRLDELPQLWNVIIGDMSLVGPRPERPEFVKEHIRTMPEFSYRLKIRAGLTGYAQVVGKYNTTTYDKLKMDLEYLTSYSLLLDFKILFLTLKVLFQRESTEGVKDNGATQQKESCGTE